MPPASPTLPDVIYNAHDAVKTAYKSITLNENSVSGSSDEALYLKTIKSLLLYVPSEEARLFVAHEVNSSRDSHDILNAGKYYFNNFVLALKQDDGSGYQTPTDYLNSMNHLSSSHLERKFTRKRQPPVTYTQAKKMALVREEFQCPITQCPDYKTNVVIHGSEPDYSHSGVHTRCFHFVNPNVEAEESVNIMNKIGYGDAVGCLKKSGIHCLENVLTLQDEVSTMFETFELWLEPTLYMPYYFRQTITFNPKNLHGLPVPGENYIAVHTLAAKLYVFSGALERKRQMELEGSEIRPIQYPLFKSIGKNGERRFPLFGRKEDVEAVFGNSKDIRNIFGGSAVTVDNVEGPSIKDNVSISVPNNPPDDPSSLDPSSPNPSPLRYSETYRQLFWDSDSAGIDEDPAELLWIKAMSEKVAAKEKAKSATSSSGV
ncbi:hypothetical protein BDQ17DRAFT_1360478 [Cyathus striatus]|nr:hypothetical protein BDQ17DRAFT_1360478 [Cyathus striatus]